MQGSERQSCVKAYVVQLELTDRRDQRARNRSTCPDIGLCVNLTCTLARLARTYVICPVV